MFDLRLRSFIFHSNAVSTILSISIAQRHLPYNLRLFYHAADKETSQKEGGTDLCIKDWRKAANLTQGQLAERIGVTQPVVAYWEAGTSAPAS